MQFFFFILLYELPSKYEVGHICFDFIHLKVLSFFISFIRGITNRPNPSIKYRQKLTNLRNPRTFLTFVGYSQYFIVSIFLSFISMVPDQILNPKQSISWLQKLFLYTLIYRLVCSNVIRIKCIYSLYSFKFLLKIKISSKQITTILSMKSFKI